MLNPYKTSIVENKKTVPSHMSSFVIPKDRIEKCRQNNIYSGTVDIFTGIIEDKNAVIKHQKSFTDYTSAIMWCRGMIAESGSDAYRLVDTDTKTCLSSGRMQGKDFVAYNNIPVIEQQEIVGLENPAVSDDAQAALEKGTEEELEHARTIARTIAEDHLKQDPNYYGGK